MSTNNTKSTDSTKGKSEWFVWAAVGVFMLLIFANAFLEDAGVIGPAKARILGAIVAVLIVVVVIALTIAFRRLRGVAFATNFLVLFLLVGFFSLLPALVFGDADRVIALKIGGILFLALLPGWIYLQFVAVKGKTLWEEYVLNLYRLHVDDYSHLPRPPVGSFFHHALGEPKETGIGRENLYKKKFRGLYGPTPGENTDEETPGFRGENLFPVMLITVLLGVAWTMALAPESLPNSTKFFNTGTLDFALPDDPLRFGFAGAYFYILQMLVRRYYQDDLKTSAYINATVRIIVTVLLVTTLHTVWPGEWGGEHAFAFFIGIFPQLGLQALRSLVAIPLRPLVPSLKQKYPLSDLDGMNTWYESRLLEEGIEDLQNLATANIVDVIVRTRIPVDRHVDWIDQAHLYLRVPGDDGSKPSGEGWSLLRRPDKDERGEANENETKDRAETQQRKEAKERKPSSREKLRRLGVRTATDLETVLAGDAADQYLWVLNEDQDPPSVTQSLVLTFNDEPNLYHVRKWKEFTKDLKDRDDLKLRETMLALFSATAATESVEDKDSS